MSAYFWKGDTFYSTECRFAKRGGHPCDLMYTGHADGLCKPCRKERKKLLKQLERDYPCEEER